MTPIFIQTDKHVINVAKVTNIILKPDKKITSTVFFGDHFIELAHADTDQLLNSIGQLGCQRPPALIAHRAKGAA